MSEDVVRYADPAMTGEQKRAWAEEQVADEYEPDPADPTKVVGPLFMDGLDEAIVGVGRQYTKPALVAYDYDLIVTALMKQGMNEDEVVEYVDFNILGAWVGEHTPFILNAPSPDD